MAPSLAKLAAKHYCLVMPRRSIITVALLWLASPVLAEDQVPVRVTGIGRMSCAHWQSSSARFSEGTVWLYGFWTALNYAAAVGHSAVSKIDAAAIIAEVQKTCTARPSQDVAAAAWLTWIDLTESKR